MPKLRLCAVMYSASALRQKLVFGRFLLIFESAMKFYDKYPKLKEKKFLAEILSRTVFSTMSLEDQQVSMNKIEQIVSNLLQEQESKGDQFFSDQAA